MLPFDGNQEKSFADISSALMSEGVKVDGENMDDNDDITSSEKTTTTKTTTMTGAIHDVMNSNVEDGEMNVNEANDNEEEKEGELIRTAMSITSLSRLPLENANMATTPEGNKNIFHILL